MKCVLEHGVEKINHFLQANNADPVYENAQQCFKMGSFTV